MKMTRQTDHKRKATPAHMVIVCGNFSMTIRLLIFLTLFLTFNYVLGQSRKDSLIVFVGEIIEVKYSPEEKKEVVDTVIRNGKKTVRTQSSLIRDSRYIAKYKISQMVYGVYNEDTIEFIVYDHYGKPDFSNYKTVLLYVSNYNGQLYHEKYMYSNVYKTTDGRWAGPYDSDDYNHDNNKNTSIKPEPISFKEPISFDINKLDKANIKEFYPEPYFRIKKDKAYPIMGNCIQELFQLKRDGYLKARGIF